MKLKYKKIILITTMSTMGIGLLTLSISNDRTHAKENAKAPAVEAGLLADADTAEISTLSTEVPDGQTVTVTEAPTSTPVPSPTPLPVYEIEEDTNPDINKLFVEFYKDKNNRDVDAIKKLLSDPTKVDSQEELQKKTQYIDSYTKIKTYTKKGFQDGTYIVYVYHEIKFTGINTAAPGLSKFYLVTGADNKLKIFSGDMDEETKEYYDARNDDTDVKALIEMTNKKSEAAVKKDEDLQSFWKNIDKLANKDSGKTDGTAE